MLLTVRRSFATLKELFKETIRARHMDQDPQQMEVVEHFEALQRDLERTHAVWKRTRQSQQPLLQDSRPVEKAVPKSDPKPSFFSGLFRRQFSTTQSLIDVKGMYLYGGSGCGKSFISDMFFANLNIRQKQRQHFHEFMGGVHNQLFELERAKRGYDPLTKMATRRAKKTRLLYLDQFQVTDVADASILRRLFEQLLPRGMVLLATSNRHPTDLYKGGHQRQFFLPFIDILQEKCKVIHLKAQDYRLALQRNSDSIDTTYLHPDNTENEERMMKIFKLVAGYQGPLKFTPVKLKPVKGRELVVERAINRVALFDFNQLVDAVMGDVDFRAICKNFRAIFIKHVRPVGSHERNLTNRLVKLFDEAYFRNVKVYLLGTEPVEKIVTIPENPRNEEQFAVIRCHSRLIEFQTKVYKEKPSFCELPQNLALQEVSKDEEE